MLKLVASVTVGWIVLLGVDCTIELTLTTTEPLTSEQTELFELSLPGTVGVRAPVLRFLLVWLEDLLDDDDDELDFDWPLFLCATCVLDADLTAATGGGTGPGAGTGPVPSWPNTLSDWVTMVSTKLEVVNLLDAKLEAFASFGVLWPLPLLSSVIPLFSRLGLAFDLLFELDVDDFELEPLRFVALDKVFKGISASFSGEESDEPLSAGIGLYGGIVLTLPPFFLNKINNW